jgi:hypothetical protein
MSGMSANDYLFRALFNFEKNPKSQGLKSGG